MRGSVEHVIERLNIGPPHGSSPAARQIELMAAFFWDHNSTSILHYCCENTIICHKGIASTFAYLLTSKSYGYLHGVGMLACLRPKGNCKNNPKFM
jgi:hypothetical protein